MRGKDKCKILKEIRQKIADENDIEFVTSECTHKGECKGTCPKCEAELKYLEDQLKKKKSVGQGLKVAAVAAAIPLVATGCSPVMDQLAQIPEMIMDYIYYKNEPEIIELDGDVPNIEIDFMGEVEETFEYDE